MYADCLVGPRCILVHIYLLKHVKSAVSKSIIIYASLKMQSVTYRAVAMETVTPPLLLKLSLL